MNHLIIDSVALLVAPAVRIEDVHAIPDWKTGEVRIRVQLRSAMDKPVVGQVRIVVAPAVSGESVAEAGCERVISAGETRLEMNLRVPHHRLWELNDPYLYRVTARVQVVGTRSADELGVRVGFRDFQFENGTSAWTADGTIQQRACTQATFLTHYRHEGARVCHTPQQAAMYREKGFLIN
jgi:beta-galactosidase/beta-glucuronidase